jgi:hypothetical protein
MVRYAEHDKELSRRVQLMFTSELFGDQYVRFQFPPTMPSDSRRGSWQEGENRGYEPFSTYNTSGAREMSLKWTYIVDGAEWTTTKIAQQVKALRGYFARVRDNADPRNLAVYFKMWSIGGIGNETDASCRIRAVDVKHGDTIIVPSGDYDLAFPLRTDVTLDLRLWTKGSKDGGEPFSELSFLDSFEEPEWF